MVIARAFFDESGTHGGEKNLCVAGYVFEGGTDEQFDSEWRQMLAKYGLAYHHMREFGSSGEGVYKHLSWEDRETSRQEAIAIIRRYASCGFAFPIEKASLAEIVKDSPWTNGYGFLANQVFYGVEQLLRRRVRGLVSFIYEAGAEGWDEALRVAGTNSQAPFRFARHRRQGCFQDHNIRRIYLFCDHANGSPKRQQPGGADPAGDPKMNEVMIALSGSATSEVCNPQRNIPINGKAHGPGMKTYLLVELAFVDLP